MRGDSGFWILDFEFWILNFGFLVVAGSSLHERIRVRVRAHSSSGAFFEKNPACCISAQREVGANFSVMMSKNKFF